MDLRRSRSKKAEHKSHRPRAGSRPAQHSPPHRAVNRDRVLGPGAAAGKIIFFDCFSGIAGDMTVAALLDLGVPLAVVERAVKALGLSGLEVSARPARVGAIAGSRFEVHATAASAEREYAEIDDLLMTSALQPEVARLAREIFRRLAEAESRVHRV